LLEPATRIEVIARLAEMGFASVALDLAGLRSGSMNALIQTKGDTKP
jgi:PP-loop superfamily ATP-utilizing enzyme